MINMLGPYYFKISFMTNDGQITLKQKDLSLAQQSR